MACKHTGARGIILGLVYVLAMIFVAPLRLTDAYEAVTLLLSGAEGTLPLLALGAAGAIPVGAFWLRCPGASKTGARGCTWRAARPGSACMALREALCCCWAPVWQGAAYPSMCLAGQRRGH